MEDDRIEEDQLLEDSQQAKENSDIRLSPFPLCGPCSLIDKTKQATSICKICEGEFLCDECTTQHKALKWTKSHPLSSIDLSAGNNETSQLLELKSKYLQTVNEDPTKLKKPGKPTAIEIKFDQVQLSWAQPIQFRERDCFEVSFKENKPDTRWKVYGDSFSTCSCILVNLKTDTQYVFRVRVVYVDMEGPYSEESDIIQTPRSTASEMVEFSVRVGEQNIIPARYALPLKEIKAARNNTARTRKFVVGNEQYRTPIEKTIMMVGETGTGKSTLVDGMANYLLGVDWSDPFRFQLVVLEDDEKTKSHNQALSQTEWITCYTIHPQKGSRYAHTINIIDTPGFGDTRGIERDREIVDQIRELFTSKGDKGVTEIDAVCFLIKAPDARLTAIQSYIFQSIMSLFGKNIEDNICSLITFADGDDPPVYAALKESNLPFGERFTFNNSGLFVNNKNVSPKSLAPIFWHMGLQSFDNFFKHIDTLFRKSLQQTGDVLIERKRIEATLETLQPNLNAALNIVKELKDEIEILEKNKSIIAENTNFEYTVDETHQVKNALLPGEYVTCCTHCHYTCHRPCGIPNDADKHGCAAMSGGICTVCPARCHWTQHQNTPYYFTFETVKVRKTYAEMEKKYKDASGKKLSQEDILRKMREKLQQMVETITKMMEVVKNSNERLTEIALRPNPLTMSEHIKQMIENENVTKKKGYQARVDTLYRLLEKTKIADTAQKLNEEFDTVGVKGNAKDTFLKGLQGVFKLFGFKLS
ncbi:uncharacterized protein LOC127844798 [Dreissena polymorpha]|uniref:Fibronectin type-III domain-containing protein n=1 Tax=Dreissena polymorpha TaxID=45954 RepID=A0A9D4E610_DREPO|nr:uncharacterized protein LOC127844798 [Dreissena polymorpha]KAH3773428.1 hypothetical protein DPMN_174789 [Dreissena polymorpha]